MQGKRYLRFQTVIPTIISHFHIFIIYMKKFTRFITALALTATVATAWAVPARKGVFDYVNPDGSTVAVTLTGDEHHHYYTTADGYVLLPDASGTLCYAKLSGDKLVKTNLAARDPELRTVSELQFLNSLNRKTLTESAEAQGSTVRKTRRARTDDLITSYPTTGSPKVLVLLVQFKDIKFSVDEPLQTFTDMLTKPGFDSFGATGSAKDYFRDNSSGIFTPDFNVIGPITVPQSVAFYGASQGQAYDTRAYDMVVDACKVYDAEHPEFDFSQFDNDGDGFIDIVYVFYAGYGQNDGGPEWTIWPHAANIWTFYGINLELDGVKVGNYACSNELRSGRGQDLAGIGTFCHEYSHILGLPDLYPTNGSRAYTPGYYELMDCGSYNNLSRTPPLMSSFCRYSLGWLNPRELSAPENVELPQLSTNTALRISSEKEDEYYMLENRQQTGWDTYLPGHGMLIWHINYIRQVWIDNTVNNNPLQQNVDLIEADNLTGYENDEGDPFPGTSYNTSFTNTSIPAMSTWIGVPIDMPLTNIREQNGMIYFRAKGGGDRIDPVTALEATDITPLAFTANWESRAGIPHYEIDLCQGSSPVPVRSVTVGAVSSYKFEGLTPETDYSYTIRAIDGDIKSDNSNRISVRTAEPYFSMLTAEVLPATNIKSDSFTANWKEVKNATRYILDVYEKDITAPKNITVDFTNAGGKFIPDGWYTTCTSTAGLAGYFGAARPSLRMSFDGDQIATPDMTDDINSLSFWYRGNNSADDAFLSIDIKYADGQWKQLHTIKPLATAAGATVTVGGESELRLPHGVKAIRVVLHKTDNNSVYLDDFSIDYAGTYVPKYVAGFEKADCGNTLSADVQGLEPLTQYYYTVQACDAEGSTSITSYETSVTTLNPSGIESVNAESLSVNVIDRTIVVTSDCAGIRLYNTEGMLTGKSADKVATFSNLESGIYFVSTDKTTTKVVVL